MILPHFATPTATAELTHHHPQITYQPLADTGLWVSQAGFGSYWVELATAEHAAALRHALRHGLNLIDTSATYTDGEAEQVIGAVLAEMVATAEISREQVVIVSKAGYLQGQNYALSQQRQAAGRPFPDLVPYGTGLEHCLHPEFLADQLTRSLARLGLETLDVYLLHNPEYYLSYAKRMGIEAAEAHTEYERRLALAFAHLEQEVAAGRIRWYGVSSNTLPSPAGSYEHTSLARLWALAQAVGGPQHHLRVVQLPFNLLERGAAVEPNQPHGRTTLATARALGVAVLVNRPLNAISGHNLVRLAEIAADLPDSAPAAEAIATAVARVADLEEQLQAGIFQMPLPFRTQQEFAASLAAARLLRQRWQGFGALSNWQDVREGYVLPRVVMGLSFLRRRPESTAALLATGAEYEQAMTAALALITAHYGVQAAAQVAHLKQAAAEANPAWAAPTLSQTAVRLLRTTPGVSCVLVGMRHTRYVDDVLLELASPQPLNEDLRGFENLAGLALD